MLRETRHLVSHWGCANLFDDICLNPWTQWYMCCWIGIHVSYVCVRQSLRGAWCGWYTSREMSATVFLIHGWGIVFTGVHATVLVVYSCRTFRVPVFCDTLFSDIFVSHCVHSAWCVLVFQWYTSETVGHGVWAAVFGWGEAKYCADMTGVCYCVQRCVWASVFRSAWHACSLVQWHMWETLCLRSPGVFGAAFSHIVRDTVCGDDSCCAAPRSVRTWVQGCVCWSVPWYVRETLRFMLLVYVLLSVTYLYIWSEFLFFFF